jgi:hypothetical protein
VAALVVPLVWGYVAYRLLHRLWPHAETADARSPRTPPPAPGADYLDFQI